VSFVSYITIFGVLTPKRSRFSGYIDSKIESKARLQRAFFSETRVATEKQQGSVVNLADLSTVAEERRGGFISDEIAY